MKILQTLFSYSEKHLFQQRVKRECGKQGTKKAS